MLTHKDFEPIASALSAAIDGLAQVDRHPDVKDQATAFLFEAEEALQGIALLTHSNPEHLPVRESVEVFERAVRVSTRISEWSNAVLPSLHKSAVDAELLERCWEAEG